MPCRVDGAYLVRENQLRAGGVDSKMTESLYQLTREEALEFAKSDRWKTWTDEQVTMFQLWQDRLCMSFDRFHEAVEHVLGRPVYTHEFAWPDKLRLEVMHIRKAPSFEEIINLLPKDKLVIVVHD